METGPEGLFIAVDKLKQLIVDETLEKKSLILLSIDEIDNVAVAGNGNASMDMSNYMSMMKALFAEHLPTVMVTVLSTHACVFDIAPTQAIISSILEDFTLELQLQPIFTELPFDVHVEPIGENQLQLEHICTTDFIATFGRSL